MWVGYDSIQNNIPQDDAEVIFGYTNGSWPTARDGWFTVHRALHKYLINIHADERDGHILDCESGDEPPEDLDAIAAWAEAAIQRNGFAGIYAAVSNIAGIVEGLEARGIARELLWVWSAHVESLGAEPASWAHVCGWGRCQYNDVKCNATQWDFHADGEVLDQSLILTLPARPAPVDPNPADLAKLDATVRDVDGHPVGSERTVVAHYRALLRKGKDASKGDLETTREHAQLLFGRLWSVVHEDGRWPVGSKEARERWDVYDREYRGKALWNVAKGTYKL